MKKIKNLSDFLDKLELFLIILIIFLISIHIILIDLLRDYNDIISLILGIITVISAISTIIIENIKDKKQKLKREKTIKDYKPNEFVPMTILILLVCIYISFIIMTYANTYNVDINKCDLTSVNIGLYSLIFVVFTFILPTYKKEIKKIEFKIDNKINKFRSNQNIKDTAFYQSEIYYLKIKFNKLTQNIIINSFIFVLSIISTFFSFFERVSFLSICSILFCLYNVINILFEVKRLYNFDLKCYEEKAKNQLKQIKDNENKNHEQK